jgi:hypothetical protein
LLTLLFSCKKNDVAIQNTSTSKIKTYIEMVTTPSSNTSDTFNVTYDASNRVTSVISTRSGLKFLYQYNSNPGYTLDIINGTQLSIRFFGFINNNSLLDSTFQFNDTNDSTTQKCIYNAAKQLIQFRTYDYSLPNGAVLFRKNDYTYDNTGNVIKDVESSPTGTVNSTITYTYTNLTGTLFSLVTMYQPVQYKSAKHRYLCRLYRQHNSQL